MKVMLDPYEVNHNCGLLRRSKRSVQRLIIQACSPKPKKLETEIIPIFIVGCGHSGTTLLASMLFQHCDVLPVTKETNSFHPLNSLWSSVSMVEQWSSIASAMEKKAIVEKTPKHIHRINQIIKYIPRSKIIFISRKALPCICSMNKRFNNLEFCIERYTIDNSAGIDALNAGQVYHVQLENLIENTEGVTRGVLEYCGLDFSKRTLQVSVNFYQRSSANGLLKSRVSQMSENIEFKGNDSSAFEVSSQEKLIIEQLTQDYSKALGY